MCVCVFSPGKLTGELIGELINCLINQKDIALGIDERKPQNPDDQKNRFLQVCIYLANIRRIVRFAVESRG